MKQCSKCKDVKALSDFYFDKRKGDGRYSCCKQCFLKMARRDEVKVHLKEYMDKYYSENREKFIIKTKKWREDNPERYRKLQRAREISFKFKSNPKYIFHVIKQNSKRKNKDFPLKREDFIEWYASQIKLCFYCGIDEETHKNTFGKRLEIDRVKNELPYQLNNIVLCCRYCNSTKGSYLTGEEMLFIGKNVILKKWKRKKL